LFARFLFWVANVNADDVTEHSDRVRYGAIGCFLTVFMAYASYAVFSFLRGAGIDAPTVPLLVVGGAVAGCIVLFDRVIVGMTDAKLDALESKHLELANAESHLLGSNLHPVGRPRAALLVGRVVLAFLMATFVAQALDNQIFRGQIEAERAKQHEAEAKKRIDDPGGPVKRLEADLQAVREARRSYDRARQGHLGDIAEAEAKAVGASRGRDVTGRRGCGSNCKFWLRNRQQAKDDYRRFVAENAANRRRWAKQSRELPREIVRKRAEIEREVRKDRGGLGDTFALFAYIADHPTTAYYFLCITVLLLLFDLAAIILKVGGRRTVYERRQALSQRMAWAGEVAARTRVQAQDLGNLGAHRDAAIAARKALREAIARAPEDEAVVRRTKEMAVKALLEHLAGERQAKRQAPKSRPEPKRTPSGGAPGGDGGGAPGGDGGGAPGGGSGPAARGAAAPDRTPEPRQRARDQGDQPRPSTVRQRMGRWPSRAVDTELKPGAVLVGREGLWLLLRELPRRQQGAHSVVWLARSADGEGGHIALKVMHVPRPTYPKVGSAERSRALNELRIVRMLPESDYIAPIVDTVKDDKGDTIWIATPYYPLGSLHDLYAGAEQPMRDLRQVLAVAVQICAALRDAQASGLVHRDLKPENVLVVKLEARDDIAPGLVLPAIRVNDWGISRVFHSVESVLERSPGGTLWYASPVVRNGGEADARDDLYSLAAVIWFLCTGYPPLYDVLEGNADVDEIDRVERQRAISPRAWDRLDHYQRNVPRALADLVERLLRYDRDARLPAGVDESSAVNWVHGELAAILREAKRSAEESEYVPMVGPSMHSGWMRDEVLTGTRPGAAPETPMSVSELIPLTFGATPATQTESENGTPPES
jgi:serine/threonine protein kinase